MTRDNSSDVSVIGSGSWGTAIVKMLLPNCRKVSWYIHDRDTLKHIKRHHNNPHFLSSVSFNTEKLYLTDNINRAIASSEVIILVTPSEYLKSTLDPVAYPMDNKLVCTAIKGIVPEYNIVVGEFIHNYYSVPWDNLVVLTGPSHAEEVAMEKLTYITLASLNPKGAKKIASLVRNSYVSTLLSDDIFGTEYAAVMKNIYSIAAGIAAGLGYGDNFLAVLLSNAAGEMKKFVDTIRENNREINSSAYLGDLLVTGYSQFSRNRVFGNMIGKGYSVSNALLGMSMVAEGYPSAKCIYSVITKMGLSLPIAETVYRILYESASPSSEIANLSKKLV